MFYVTGDTHGDFGERLYRLDRFEPTKDDTLIILGDAGINYCCGDDIQKNKELERDYYPPDKGRDYRLKKELAKEKITFFCVHGNHEERPFNIPTYHEVKYRGALRIWKTSFLI